MLCPSLQIVDTSSNSTSQSQGKFTCTSLTRFGVRSGSFCASFAMRFYLQGASKDDDEAPADAWMHDVGWQHKAPLSRNERRMPNSKGRLCRKPVVRGSRSRGDKGFDSRDMEINQLTKTALPRDLESPLVSIFANPVRKSHHLSACSSMAKSIVLALPPIGKIPLP